MTENRFSIQVPWLENVMVRTGPLTGIQSSMVSINALFTNREKEFISLQSICIGPRMIHGYLALKPWILFMYAEVIFSSGDVLPLWDALFSFQWAWHSVSQAVSLGMASLRTQQRVGWFWGDKAQEGVAKLQSPSSNGGPLPFPVFEEQQGRTSSPTGVPQHLRLMGPLQCMPVTPTLLMGATGFSTIFTTPF